MGDFFYICDMKNIILLPTDKPSRLMIDTIENKLYLQPILHEKTINVLPQNIYITSDEKIKVGDFYITTDNKILQCDNVLMGLIYATNDYGRNSNGCKKIILTTDQSLDGVQEIDDEFLQWFVQNQSCDVVEVQKLLLCTYCGGDHCDNLACRGWEDKPYYEIIIPQNKTACSCVDGIITCPGCDGEKESEFGVCAGCEGVGTVRCGKCGGEEPKQEKMYSRQDMIDFVYFINDRHSNKYKVDTDEVDLFIEQFKKK